MISNSPDIKLMFDSYEHIFNAYEHISNASEHDFIVIIEHYLMYFDEHFLMFIIEHMIFNSIQSFWTLFDDFYWTHSPWTFSKQNINHGSWF